MNKKFIKYVIEEDEEEIRFIPEYEEPEETPNFALNTKSELHIDKDLWDAVVNRLKEDLRK